MDGLETMTSEIVSRIIAVTYWENSGLASCDTRTSDLRIIADNAIYDVALRAKEHRIFDLSLKVEHLFQGFHFFAIGFKFVA